MRHRPCSYGGAYSVLLPLFDSRPRFTYSFFRLFLVGFAVPIQALMIPLYVESLRLHLYDTLIGLILPMAAFSVPITMLVLVNFLRDVPRSLMDAMDLDGAGPVRVVRSLVLPMSWPAVIAVGIFSFVTDWNNFLFPLILTERISNATLPLSVFNFEGNHLSNVGQIMASVTLSALPLWGCLRVRSTAYDERAVGGVWWVKYEHELGRSP